MQALSLVERAENSDLETALYNAVEAGRAAYGPTQPEQQEKCLSAITALVSSIANSPAGFEIAILGKTYHFEENDIEFYKRLSNILTDPVRGNVLELQGVIDIMLSKGDLRKKADKYSNEFYLGVAWHEAGVVFTKMVSDMARGLVQAYDVTPI